tara:strand:+ start:179 stop:661 length:483 start_codon:yes stop_codon:yes gene_type:complete
MKAIYELRLDGKVITSSEDYGFIVQRAVGIAMYVSRIYQSQCDFVNPTKDDQEFLKSSERMLDKWENGMSIIKIDTYTHHLNADGYMYVIMDKNYTATVRCLKTFEDYIIKEKKDLRLMDLRLDIKYTSEECPVWFSTEVKKLIEKYQEQKFFELYNNLP